ncbi:4Fe-4S ferredoxin [Thiopseudomonas alkaliphila]|uniref:Coenzyme F420 hydrogenase/dehydrogenase, beta subunit C-terminal domain n=1 Tax=Thiopseudomonas alkaliphila TaxID=1697053 RepID=UPI00069FE85B|nr:Coenzyme F420 hydrogenase/dehydrogenase, beta subunit C-terminal domain [Thiopseudomonas alkaliphila]AKX46874.1 4Fe-4S ferredoxin [Thiopseudomonas alkaliphila]
MVSKPQVIAQVVDNDMCIGCGLCTYKCTSNALTMGWNKQGFLVPALTGSCDNDAACISVCPFNPAPNESVKNETVLAESFLSEGTKIEEKLGRLIGIYAGYSNEFRETSSSGGIATYILDQLFDKGIVEHIFSVRSSNEAGTHYQYQVASNKAELRDSAKTKYYPVTLATVLLELNKLEGKVAIVGIACFVKAIRLAQHYDASLKEKIPFVAGIICGGVKSKFFTEYLASKAGVDPEVIQNPDFRIKDVTSTASNYAFGCKDTASGEYKKIKMLEVGDMWGTGLFKANACDFCDDVVTELADISLGDAWLDPYSQDGRGTSVIITRSPLAEALIQEGLVSSALELEPLSSDRMRASQQGSYNHRHDGLYVRVKEVQKKGIPISEKRYGKKAVSFDVLMVQKLRRATRQKSLDTWLQTQSATAFDEKMEKTLLKLKMATKVNHLKRMGLKRFLQRLTEKVLNKK